MCWINVERAVVRPNLTGLFRMLLRARLAFFFCTSAIDSIAIPLKIHGEGAGKEIFFFDFSENFKEIKRKKEKERKRLKV